MENRADERDHRFTGSYSLTLKTSDGKGGTRSVGIRPVDVSGRGLGFHVREFLKVGGHYTLEIGAARFRVEIAYCGPHLGIENLYRCGLFLREAEGNLRESCRLHGLLADES